MSRLPLPPAEPMKLTRLAEIARGGMGSVELARVEGGRLAGEIVAIKRLHANIANDPQFVSMFLDEAWLTSALHHPNVVGVAAWGEDERGMFLAIEFVQGVSLARLLKESKQNKEMFAERTVANLCSQICGGLTAAHGLRGPDGALLGLVHRDLTPGNVLVTFDGLLKIVDFGIAKAEERITHTQTGMLKGKPAYMAPEQARGGQVDQRSDIFSFGVLMFELLAGRRPWLSKAAFDVMMEIAREPVPDLASLRPALNPEFIAIVNKCLEKKPDDRFNTAAEIQARLDAWRVQKGFTSDDPQSLGAFVTRNSAAQIAWYEMALRGEFAAKAEAETFKELEEKIDAEREAKDKPKKKPPPLRPAAGRPADPVPSSQPLPPASPAAALIPKPEPTLPTGHPPPSRSRPDVAPPPSSGSPKVLAGAGTEYMTMSPFAGGNMPDVRPPPSSSAPKVLAGAGTEYMTMSPFAGGNMPSVRTPSAPPPAGFGSGVHAAPPSSASGFGSGVHAAPPSSASAPAPAPPPAGRSWVSYLVVALVGMMLAAIAFYAWQRRALLQAPPAPPPAPSTAPSGN